VTYPQGAVVLQQNLPTPVGDRTLVAYNVKDGTARVDVLQGQGAGPASATVSAGTTVTLDGARFEVVAVTPDPDHGDQPGSARGVVVLLPRS
jgi:hypothetical protein